MGGYQLGKIDPTRDQQRGLNICMLAGRLELYTVAVLLTPDFWVMARKQVWRWKLQESEGRHSG